MSVWSYLLKCLDLTIYSGTPLKWKLLTHAVQHMWLHFPTSPSLCVDKKCWSNKECAVFATRISWTKQMSVSIIRSILYNSGTGRAGKPVHFEIVEAYVNQGATHLYRPVFGPYTFVQRIAIHKGSTAQCYILAWCLHCCVSIIRRSMHTPYTHHSSFV